MQREGRNRGGLARPPQQGHQKASLLHLSQPLSGGVSTRWPQQVQTPRVVPGGNVESRRCPAEGLWTTAGQPPIVLSGIDAAEERPTLSAGVPSQPERYAMTPTSQGAPRKVGPQASEDLGDFRRIADSLASVASQHGQGSIQMIVHVARTGLHCRADVPSPSRKGPPQSENQRGRSSQGDALRGTRHVWAPVEGVRGSGVASAAPEMRRATTLEVKEPPPPRSATPRAESAQHVVQETPASSMRCGGCTIWCQWGEAASAQGSPRHYCEQCTHVRCPPLRNHTVRAKSLAHL